MFELKGIHTVKTSNKLDKINLPSPRSNIATITPHHTDRDNVK